MKNTFLKAGFLIQLSLVLAGLLFPRTGWAFDLLDFVDSRVRIGASMSEPEVRIYSMARGYANLSGLGVYDDGYVQSDAVANSAGSTWNWGVSSASQVNDDGTISFTRKSFNSHSSESSQEVDARGVNLTWLPGVLLEDNVIRLSPLASLDVLPLDVRMNVTDIVSYTSLEDHYSYGLFDPGLVAMPYSGTFAGPGPLLGDSVVSSNTQTIPDGAQVNRRFVLDGRLVTIGMGAELQYTATDTVSAFLQARFLLGWFRGDFEYNESFEHEGSTYGEQSEAMDVSETLVGTSIGVGALWTLNDATRIFVSANKLLLQSVENGVDGQVFSIDFSKGHMLVVGIQRLF